MDITLYNSLEYTEYNRMQLQFTAYDILGIRITESCTEES